MSDLTTETSSRPSDAADPLVAELTAELAATVAALTAARRELETLRVTHYELLRAHEALRASTAFRAASRVWALGDRVRRR